MINSAVFPTADVAALDAADALAPYRDLFALPEGVIYLDGNSLGALPKETPARVARVMHEEWGTGLIRSWNSADWIGAPQRVGGKIARLVGAEAHEVVVADSTSVNLHKLIVAALGAQTGRRTVLSEPLSPRWVRAIGSSLCRATRSSRASPRTLPW
jgi:kynureninase